jgi:hypothetical protein
MFKIIKFNTIINTKFKLIIVIFAILFVILASLLFLIGNTKPIKINANGINQSELALEGVTTFNQNYYITNKNNFKISHPDYKTVDNLNTDISKTDKIDLIPRDDADIIFTSKNNVKANILINLLQENAQSKTIELDFNEANDFTFVVEKLPISKIIIENQSNNYKHFNITNDLKFGRNKIELDLQQGNWKKINVVDKFGTKNIEDKFIVKDYEENIIRFEGYNELKIDFQNFKDKEKVEITPRGKMFYLNDLSIRGDSAKRLDSEFYFKTELVESDIDGANRKVLAKGEIVTFTRNQDKILFVTSDKTFQDNTNHEYKVFEYDLISQTTNLLHARVETNFYDLIFLKHGMIINDTQNTDNVNRDKKSLYNLYTKKECTFRDRVLPQNSMDYAINFTFSEDNKTLYYSTGGTSSNLQIYMINTENCELIQKVNLKTNQYLVNVVDGLFYIYDGTDNKVGADSVFRLCKKYNKDLNQFLSELISCYRSDSLSFKSKSVLNINEVTQSYDPIDIFHKDFAEKVYQIQCSESVQYYGDYLVVFSDKISVQYKNSKPITFSNNQAPYEFLGRPVLSFAGRGFIGCSPNFENMSEFYMPKPVKT